MRSKLSGVLLFVFLLGGCSLVVDFDRSLLRDAGIDGSIGPTGGAAGAGPTGGVGGQGGEGGVAFAEQPAIVR